MAANLHITSKTYTPSEKNSTLCSGTGVKWFIHVNKILNIILPAKGSELPTYHPRRVGEQNLLTTYAKKKKTCNRQLET